MGIMYYDADYDFAYERRGKNWYAFCDKGCSVIIRKEKTALNAAMRGHAREHDGQQALELFPRKAYHDSDPLRF